MNRRNFLKVLGVVPSALMIPKWAVIEPLRIAGTMEHPAIIRGATIHLGAAWNGGSMTRAHFDRCTITGPAELRAGHANFFYNLFTGWEAPGSFAENEANCRVFVDIENTHFTDCHFDHVLIRGMPA